MRRTRKTKRRTALKKSQQRVGKKVNCEYCDEEISLRVRKNAVGPFFHTLCEQAWQLEQSGGPILATSKNYHDVEKDEEWRDLSITLTESVEDTIHNTLIEKRNKRHGDKIFTPKHSAFSYNHKGEVVYSARDKQTLSEAIKTQDLYIMILRNKLK
jgi:transcription elongation factor Elf1